jgi:hypothetical protein
LPSPMANAAWVFKGHVGAYGAKRIFRDNERKALGVPDGYHPANALPRRERHNLNCGARGTNSFQFTPRLRKTINLFNDRQILSHFPYALIALPVSDFSQTLLPILLRDAKNAVGCCPGISEPPRALGVLPGRVLFSRDLGNFGLELRDFFCQDDDMPAKLAGHARILILGHWMHARSLLAAQAKGGTVGPEK